MHACALEGSGTSHHNNTHYQSSNEQNKHGNHPGGEHDARRGGRVGVDGSAIAEFSFAATTSRTMVRSPAQQNMSHGLNCQMEMTHHHHQPFTPISSPRPKQNANHVTQHSWPLPPTLHPPTHSAHHKEDSPAAAISISTKRKATKKARREEQSCQSLIRPQTICAPRRLGCQRGFHPYS